MTFQAMLDDVLQAGAGGWVHLYEVEWIAKTRAGIEASDVIFELSTRVIRALLSDGLVELGDVKSARFAPWRLPIDEALERVERSRHALEREPSFGDVCCLALTKRGEEVAALGGVRRSPR
jgi:hypothetical protein